MFYSNIAGMQPHSNGTTGGWRHIVFRPSPAAVQRLGHAAADIHTPLGLASVSWSVAAATLAINATVPAGAMAELTFPLLGVDAETVVIFESGQAVWQAGKFVASSSGVRAGVASRRGDNLGVTFSLVAGLYGFSGLSR